MILEIPHVFPRSKFFSALDLNKFPKNVKIEYKKRMNPIGNHMQIAPGPAKDEYVVIVDEKNAIRSRELRSVMRKERLIHRATFILVFNRAGELFVQKRSKNKDLYPGFYDLSTGGVVLWDEEMEPSAKRELEEELGIRGTPLDFLFDFFYESPKNRVFGHGYRCIQDGPFTLQKEEIDSGLFLLPEAVPALLRSHPVTPESAYVFNRYITGPHATTHQGRTP